MISTYNNNPRNFILIKIMPSLQEMVKSLIQHIIIILIQLHFCLVLSLPKI